jgi:uncharacterized protein (TIGR01777 family)
MRVLISGSSGLVGRALTEKLRADSHETVGLPRTRVTGSDKPYWEPIRAGTWNTEIGPVDAVVHLAGENVASRRWSQSQKQRIYNSRVTGTGQLCEHLAGLEKRPEVLVCASATGIYGDRGDQVLIEESAPGEGFLADVCHDWEAACGPASEAGIRVVNLRIGMVLAPGGGALTRLLQLFKAGLGGRLGSGRQYMSWITLDDLLGVILFALTRTDLGGPVNAVAPQPATNREFTRTLGRILHRPTLFPVPAFALRLAVGEMAHEMLLASARVVPRRLLDNDFRFHHADLETALRATIPAQK